jgi:glutaminyl-tRNA synthetase
MQENAAALAESTWASLSGTLANLKVTDELRWASPLDVKKSLETAYTNTFGTKEDYNKAQASTSKSAKQAKAAKPSANAASSNAASAEASTSASTSSTSMFEEGFLAKLHPVGGNPQLLEELREMHMKATGGLVHTRFPPEPNGISLFVFLA